MNIKPNRILIGAFSFLAALVVLQTAATAQTVTLTLVAPPSSSSYPDGDNASAASIYLSPYYFNVTNSSGTTVQALICDDFSDDIYLNESWSATVFSNGQIPSANYGALASSGVAPTTAAYEEIGYLAYELMQPPTPTNGKPSTVGGPDQAALSFAIWSILEPSVVTSAVALADLGPTDYSGYTSALSTADNIAYNPENAALATIYLKNLTIYQPSSLISCPSGSTCGAPQQFVGLDETTLGPLPPVMPEALSPAFLGFDLLTLFVAVFLVRRRRISNAGDPR